MTDIDRIDQRLAAVERVVVDGDVAVDELGELTVLTETVDSLEGRLEEHEGRLGTLEASVQSVEGYVGNVESISDDVERQAASAVATVDRLERRLEVLEADLDDVAGGILESGEAVSDLEGSEPDRSDLDRSKSDRSDLVEPGSDRSCLEDEKARRDTGGEISVFEFGGIDGESIGESVGKDPVVERSVRKLFEEDSKSGSIVDDGVDRPGSSATQSSIDSAVRERDTQQASERPEDTERQIGGLLASIRSRLS